ncbi:autotransporter domain-containing protein [Emcibacter sp. SYSU 3D8]|uniref:autotransporter domain-containing protein n=1 Tax=Emcibacter sp. SYSU 3D8 TaxID=3133969 RepID=UPI0031FEB05A
MYQVRPRRRLRAGYAIAGGLVVASTMGVPDLSEAADLTITKTVTEPVNTANASSGPGNILIESGGAVSVDKGTAVTVNSNNTVENNGRIQSSGGIDSRGIVISGSVTSDITNKGTISLGTDADDDTKDGGNYGIYLQPGASMAGDILNDTGGTITVDGFESAGIFSAGSLTGSIKNDGQITATGEAGVGVLVSGNVSGSVTNNGSISTGVGSSQSFDSKGNTITIPETPGGDGLAIAGSVSGGIVNTGDGLTDVEEKSLTAGTVETIRGLKKDDIGVDATITIIGPENALHVGPDAGGTVGGNLTIGAVGADEDAYGIINRGDMTSSSTADNGPAETVRIGLGAGTGATGTTTVVGGFLNDGGDITTKSDSGKSTSVAIGSGAILPELNNVGTIKATTETGDAYALSIEQSAQLDKLTNSGLLEAEATSVNGDAITIVDASDTLKFIENTGTISSIETIGADIKGLPITSTGTAIDLSVSTVDVSVLNTGTIAGDVLFGTGDDSYTLDGGTQTGTIDFGGGENTFMLNNAMFSGDLAATKGSVDLDVKGSTFAIVSEDGAQVRDAAFDKDSTLVVPIFGSDAIAGTLTASGTVSFADGTGLVTDFKTLSAEDITFTLVDAATLTFETDVTGLMISDTSAFFNVDVAIDEEDPGKLVVTVHRATAEELGLNGNQTAVFNVTKTLLEQDTEMGAAMANLKTAEEVQDAFNQLMPDNSGATQQGIFQTQAAIFGAINKRMDGIYKLDQRYKERVERIAGKDPKRAKRMSKRNQPTIWAEQLVLVANQSPFADQLGYGGYSYGVALGADYPLLGLDAVGISLSQVWSEYKEKTSFDKPTAVSTTQFNVYAGWENSGFFVDVSGGYGFSSYDGERNIVIGSVSRTSLGEWSGHHMAANVRAGYNIVMGRYTLGAAASFSWMKLHENGYVETGLGENDTSGAATNLVVGEQDVSFARGNFGLTAGMRFEDGTGLIEPQIRVGATHEFSYKGPTNAAYFGFLKDGNNLPTRLSDDFMTVGALAAKTTYYAGVGVDLSAHFGTLSFDYDAEFGGGKLNHIVSGTVRVSF